MSTDILKNPVVLAPMAGVSDKAWRIMARKYGCGLVYTEMISAKALTYRSTKTYDLLDTTDEDEPIAVQLFGSEPPIMAEGAKIAVEKGAKIIDINMGCPVPKVVKNQEGSALMCNPSLAGEIVKAMTDAVTVPVLVKMRIGWDEENINAVEFAKVLEDAGASMLAVHGRTRSQYYQGKANWDIIAQVKEGVKIPVIANGDVFTPEDAKNILDITACDGVMIGRGAMGKPWLYGQARDYILTSTYQAEPSVHEKIQIMLEHVRLCIQYKGEYVAMREMRHHIAWYCKGMRNSAKLRSKISTIDRYDDLVELFAEFEQMNQESL